MQFLRRVLCGVRRCTDLNGGKASYFKRSLIKSFLFASISGESTIRTSVIPGAVGAKVSIKPLETGEKAKQLPSPQDAEFLVQRTSESYSV